MVLRTREWKGSWRSCSDRKKSNTSQLLASKFHSSPKCLICKQCWAQACVQTEEIEKEQKRDSNDRLMAITCAHQQLLSVPALEGKIRRVGKVRQQKGNGGVEICRARVPIQNLHSLFLQIQTFSSVHISQLINNTNCCRTVSIMNPWSNTLIKRSVWSSGVMAKHFCEQQ